MRKADRRKPIGIVKGADANREIGVPGTSCDAAGEFNALYRTGIGLINLEAFSHAQYVVHGKAEAAVEFDDLAIGGADLEVDLGTAALAEEPLGVFHDLAAITVSPERLGDGEVIDPAAMAFVAGHDGGDKLRVEDTDDE